MKFRLSELAKSDLDDARAYTIETWGRDQWLRYFRRLIAGFERIEANPDAGRDRSDFLPGMRSVAVERHVVFYRAFGPDVVILRVVHQRRDMAAMGFEG